MFKYPKNLEINQNYKKFDFNPVANSKILNKKYFDLLKKQRKIF